MGAISKCKGLGFGIAFIWNIRRRRGIDYPETRLYNDRVIFDLLHQQRLTTLQGYICQRTHYLPPHNPWSMMVSVISMMVSVIFGFFKNEWLYVKIGKPKWLFYGISAKKKSTYWVGKNKCFPGPEFGGTRNLHVNNCLKRT